MINLNTPIQIAPIPPRNDHAYCALSLPTQHITSSDTEVYHSLLSVPFIQPFADYITLLQLLIQTPIEPKLARFTKLHNQRVHVHKFSCICCLSLTEDP